MDFLKKIGSAVLSFGKGLGEKIRILGKQAVQSGCAFGKKAGAWASAFGVLTARGAAAFWKRLVWLAKAFRRHFHGKSLVLLIVNCVLLVVITASAVTMIRFVYADGALYPRGGDTLDLRGQAISVEAFDTLTRKKPGCQILWDVPFQGSRISNETASLTVTSLSDADLAMLEYFPGLTTLDGTGCPDLKNLNAFRQSRTVCKVLYQVTVGEEAYHQDTASMTLTGITAEEAANMVYLPGLSQVQVSDCLDYPLLQQLQQEHPQWNLTYTVALGDQVLEQHTESADIRDAGFEELTAALTGLPALKELHLTNPRVQGKDLLELQQQYPQISLSWDVELYGKTYGIDTTELDISNTKVGSCEEVEELVMSLPNLEKLIMSYCGIDNEAMAQFRERQRENYKVVWTVQLSDKTICRTDALYFMPIQQGEYYFQEEDGYNLRYCEDIICLDLGHHPIKSIEFVQYMPKLKYLILAFTRVQDVSPIVHCQELVYLEVDWSEIKDFTPIAQLKNLEDLNINQTSADITPILQMTWLKNILAFSRSAATKALLTEHLTETNLMLYSTAGWRQTENYYAQRDVLGMHYMRS